MVSPLFLPLRIEPHNIEGRKTKPARSQKPVIERMGQEVFGCYASQNPFSVLAQSIAFDDVVIAVFLHLKSADPGSFK
jgi:hypothetical protein